MSKIAQTQDLKKKKILRNCEIMSNKQFLKSRKRILLRGIGMMIWLSLISSCSRMRKMNLKRKMLRMNRNERRKKRKDENERRKKSN